MVDLSAAWLLEVEASEQAKSTKARYATIVKQFINPGVGQLRLRELSVPAVDRLLRVIVERSGATTAKGARSVMSGMAGMAMRHGAMTTNPTRDVAPISVTKKIVKVLKQRTEVANLPSPIGRVRYASNTAADLRRSLDYAGFDWVSSHTFRETVATRLDDAGLSARAIADHLRHAQPSTSQDVYLGRRVASSDAANVLDR